jgi:hypothetical protein
LDQREKITILFRRYVNNECTAEEMQQLMGYFANDAYKPLLEGLIRQELEGAGEAGAQNPGNKAALDNLFQSIKKRINKKS